MPRTGRQWRHSCPNPQVERSPQPLLGRTSLAGQGVGCGVQDRWGTKGRPLTFIRVNWSCHQQTSVGNPFQIRWLDGWLFKVIHEGSKVLLEAHGYGIRLQRPLQAGETPRDVADRMIWQEHRQRRSIKTAWQHRGQQGSGPDRVTAVTTTKTAPLAAPRVDAMQPVERLQSHSLPEVALR